MTDECRLYLSARRPCGKDDADPAIAEALQRASQDPALAAWVDEQARTDRCLAQKLCGVPAPAGLRERILAGGKVSRPGLNAWFERRVWRSFRNSELLAAAAIVLLLGVAVVMQYFRGPDEPKTWQEAGVREVAAIEQAGGVDPLDRVVSDLPEIRKWLASQVCPAPSTLPVQVQQLPIIGCAKRAWRGQMLSVVCFNLKPGRQVHLVTVERKLVPAEPPVDTVLYAEVSGYQTASWSSGAVSMMLAGKVERADLERLFTKPAVAREAAPASRTLAARPSQSFIPAR
jgi:hypothetical protein